MDDTKNRVSFTKERLLSLPLPSAGKRDTYHDTKTTGLQLRVTPAGEKTFSVYRRLKGRHPVRFTLGKFPTMTIEQARRLAADVNAEIEAGANPAEARRAFKAEPTLTEFFQEYADRHGKKKRTWKDDEQRFRDYLQKPLGRYKLTEITRPMIAKALGAAEKAGKAVATVRNIRALVSGVLGKAVEWGHIDLNPATGVKVAGRKVERDRYLKAHEMTPFFQAVALEPPMTRDFILLALLTGARRANLCAMRWQEIDFQAGVWRIPRTKNDEPQDVTLCPEAVGILEARKASETSPYVFPGRGKSGHFEAPKKAVVRVLARAGIPYGRKVPDGVTLHDLRRTLGSWQARSGASLVIIGKSLNHKSQQATKIYARLDLDPVRQSVNQATSAMLEAGEVKEPAGVMTLRKAGTA
jgi:integrase